MERLIETVNQGFDKGSKALGSVIDDIQYGQTSESHIGKQILETLNQRLTSLNGHIFHSQNPVWKEYCLCLTFLGLKSVLQSIAMPKDGTIGHRSSLLKADKSSIQYENEANQSFLILGVAYISSSPDLQEASNLFKIFTLLSSVHTLSILFQDRIPRLLSVCGLTGINIFMGLKALKFFLSS